jgi:hypothetical protein
LWGSGGALAAADALRGTDPEAFIAEALQGMAQRAASVGPQRVVEAMDAAASLARDGRFVAAIRAAAVAPLRTVDGDRAGPTAGAEGAGGPREPPRGPELTHAVRALLPERPTAPPDNDRLTQLRGALESAANDAPTDAPRPSPVSLRRAKRMNYRTLVRRLASHIAPGADGLRNEHLVCMAHGPNGRAFVQALRDFTLAMLEHGVGAGSRAAALFGAARMALIPKRDGAWRPIGVVTTLRRLCCRVGLLCVAGSLVRWLLRAGQLGVRVESGVEALAAAAQAAFDRGDWALLIDRANAYGSIDHRVALVAAQATLPVLGAFFATLLSAALIVGGGDVLAWQGLFQGCPFAPLLFVLVMDGAMWAAHLAAGGLRAVLRARTTPVDSLAFLDDGMLSGRNPLALLQALADVDAATSWTGLRVRPSKCVAIAPAGAHPIDRATADAYAAAGSAAGATGIPIAAEGVAVRVVGSPVGTHEGRRAWAENAIHEVRTATEALLRRLDIWRSVALLRASRHFPVAVHLLRSLPPDVGAAAVAPLDAARDEYLARVLHLSLDRLRALPLYESIGLPLRCGGRDIRTAAAAAPAAAVAGSSSAHRVLAAVCGTEEALNSYLRPERYAHDGTPERDAYGPLTPGCRGEARCGMPTTDGCPRQCCLVCCRAARVGTTDACAACDDAAAAALADEPGAVASREWDALPSGHRNAWCHALTEGAAAAARSTEEARTVAILALRYRRPQRAAWCALATRRVRSLEGALRADSRWAELATLRANGDVIGQAFWTPAPMRAHEPLSDDTVRCRIADSLAVPVLEGARVTCAVAASGAPECLAVRSRSTSAAADPSVHARMCRHGGLTIWAHNLCLHAVANVARGYGFAVATEDRALFNAGSKARADVVVRAAGACARDLVMDVSRCDLVGAVLSDSDRGRSFASDALRRGGVAEVRAAGKRVKYALLWRDPGEVDFLPGTWDHVGGCSASLRDWVAVIAARAADVSGGHAVDIQHRIWAVIADANAVAVAWQYAVAAVRAERAEEPGEASAWRSRAPTCETVRQDVVRRCFLRPGASGASSASGDAVAAAARAAEARRAASGRPAPAALGAP